MHTIIMLLNEMQCGNGLVLVVDCWNDVYGCLNIVNKCEIYVYEWNGDV